MKSALYCGVVLLLIAGCVVLATHDDAQYIIERSFGVYEGPDWKLKEIRVWGTYTGESEQEIRDAEEDLKWYLENGESVLEKFAHLGLGEEKFDYAGQRFCYFITDKETRMSHPVINSDLRIRLYDREANILSEGVLRDEFPENTKRSFPTKTEETAYYWKIIAYVPYHDEGHSLRLVRLENGKDVLLEQLEFRSLHGLLQEIDEGAFFAYRLTDSGCFVSPPMR